jgi:flavin-dependent dehydrogenase
MITAAPEHDVLVIGGGPAGSAVAGVLAGNGRSVVVLERERFPRYKVGESLIPYCWFPLERLGLNERVAEAACTIPKHSVQFVGLDGKRSKPFYFAEHTEHACARTWQVVRGEFDEILLANAAERGATVMRETTAKELIRAGDTVVGCRAVDAAGNPIEVRARVTVDASGRDLFAISRNDWKVPDPVLRKIAIWRYYDGAGRDTGIDAGATTIAALPERGWFWYIPLAGDQVSVGIVGERDYLYRGPRDPEAIFEREVGVQPWIAERLAPGRVASDCRVTGDYSYRAQHCAADGLVLVGDAFAFLDPVFSSGVFLALQSGVLAGDAIEAALAAGDLSASRFRDYGERLTRGIEVMRRLVYVFYDETFSFGGFVRDHPEFLGDVTDCLIGNVFKDLDALFAAMAHHANVPQPLAHGRPLET